MAITNFTAISADTWNQMSSNYTRIAPVVTGSGTTDPNLSVVFYVNNTDNTKFVIQISSSGAESVVLSLDATTANQMDVQCIPGSGGQGNVYHSLNESQGWTDNFNVTLAITNTNSSNGKMIFTKGKGERPHR